MSLRLGCSFRAIGRSATTSHVAEVAAAEELLDLDLAAAAVDADAARAIAAWGCRVDSLSLVTSPASLSEIEASAEVAASLGARCLIWDGGVTNGESDAGGAALFRAAEQAAGLCSKHGVGLAIVNSVDGPVRDVRTAMAFCARIPDLAPAGTLGCAFDAGAAIAVGANPMLLVATMEEALTAVLLAEAEGDRRPLPGPGETPWPALLRAIAATGFAGPLMLAGEAAEASELGASRHFLEPLFAAIATDGDPCAQPPPPGVLEGIRRFNAGDYHGAHEDFEHEWHAERRPIRRLYQGMLQIGVGLHHARGGNHRGAIALLTDGIAKTSAFLPACQGIDTARLVRESQRCLDLIGELGPERLGAFDWSLAPRVHMTPADDQAS